MFETAKIITNFRFCDRIPVPVFHPEEKPMQIPHDPTTENRHILFRREVNLPALTGKAVLYLSADDYYKLYINGRFVTQGPAAGYPTRYYYNRVDVTSYLHEGKNLIAVHTYYQGLINRVWVSADERHMFVCQLELDEKIVLVSDTDWRCTEHTGYTASHKIGYDTQFAECFDSRVPEVGFEDPDYDDSAWGYAKVRRYTDYAFVLQPTEQLDLYSVSPARISRRAEEDKTVLFGDLGFEAVGYLTLRAKGISGSVVLIRCGEECLTDENGRDTDAVRYDMRCNCRYEETWTLSGKADTLYPYDYKAFRYFELHLPSGCSVADEDVCIVIRHYPFRCAVSCPTKEPTLSAVWKLCADTLKYGAQEGFMDCPTREKGQYMNDGTVSFAAYTLLTGNPALMKKALYDAAHSSFITDGLMTVSPASLMQEIAEASMQYPMQILFLYRHGGGLQMVQDLYPYAEGAWEHFRKFDRGDGLLEEVDTWNLIDWPENLRDGYDFPGTKPIGKGCHNVINAFWYGMCRDMDEIRALVGKEPKANYTEAVAKSFCTEFYDPEQKLFTDSKMTRHTAAHSNLLPLYFNLDRVADGTCRPVIVSMLQKKGLCTGVCMSYFLLAALKQAGENEIVLELLTSSGGWCNMLKEGATTTFEAWGKNQKWNTSLFHPWATAPILILGE